MDLFFPICDKLRVTLKIHMYTHTHFIPITDHLPRLSISYQAIDGVQEMDVAPQLPKIITLK